VSAPSEMPIGILQALDMLKVTLARGCPLEGPYWQSPKGGRMNVQWMERTQSYRFTLDLKPPLPFPETWPPAGESSQ
jgi:hypothetical protein